MLVLTRQVDEEILIGPDIRVKVLAVSGGQVRLGLEAPRTVAVLRREVLDAVSAQNATATTACPEALRALVANRQKP